ncbi:MAG: hypothetical protein P8Y21_09225 [Gemmatimonadales bacterium]
MNADKKAAFARILGYICVAVGVLNLALAVVDRPGKSALTATGLSALMLGIIMIAVGKRKPTPKV